MIEIIDIRGNLEIDGKEEQLIEQQEEEEKTQSLQ